MNDDTKYLVFLDIDGVLTSSRVHMAQKTKYELWAKFDQVAVDFFNQIHFKYPVEFVVMSTWKDHLREDDKNIKHWIMSAFQNSGFHGTFGDPWKTNPDNLMHLSDLDRAYEVKDYLGLYGKDVSDFILFDDNAYRFNEVLGVKRLVRTDPDNGLLVKHMKNAKSIIGEWHERK